MSLFSKLFSRDDKVPEESQGENAQANSASPTRTSKKPEAAAGGGAAARNTGGKAAAAEKTEQTSVATPSDKAGQDAQPQPAAAKPRNESPAKDARAAAPPPAAPKGPPIKPGAAGKRDRPLPNKTLVGHAGIANAMPPQPMAAVPPAPAGAAKPQAPAPSATTTAAKAPAPAAPRIEPQVTHHVVAKPPTVQEPAEPRIVEAKPPSAAAAAVIVETPVQVMPQPPAAARPEPKAHANLESALDAAMDALVANDQPSPPASSGGDASDDRALAETFAAVAKVHAQPLREFMFQLDLGRTPREWSLASRPVLRPLLEAAQQIGMLELVGALGGFDAALERAAAEPADIISERGVQALKAAYQGLCLHMPDVFTPESANEGRRTVYLESLLLQIPELHRRTLTKLYAAGLSSLSQLSQARPDELSAVAGIEENLAKRMVEHVQRFERSRTSLAPADIKTHSHERLREIVARLAQLQADFERAESEDSAENKRIARRGREAALRELDLVFAEMGEVSVIEELKRCPVQQKIRRVATYLEAAQATA